MYCTQRENRQSRLWKDERGQTMTLQQQKIFFWAMMSWIILKRKIFNFFTIENPIEILIFTISQKNDYNSKTKNNTHPNFLNVFKDIVSYIMWNFQAN